MPRLSRLAALAPALVLSGAAIAQTNGHFRAGNLTRPCMVCHKGHGVPGSPVLATAGDELCLPCHSMGARNEQTKASLGMSPSANPQDIDSELRKAYSHRQARCLDCHSAHRAVETASPNVAALGAGLLKGSRKRGFANETGLCLSCHGSRGPRGADVHDLAARFDPTNPSFHPVVATGRSASVPSLLPPFSETSFVNCTDCHGSDSRTGPKGPHGSQHTSLLRRPYSKQDNQPESPASYGLCYECHDRHVVLHEDAFPLHKEHVVENRTACWVCHDPHGATEARALIRFNEPGVLAGVAPSASGRIAFVSTGPGSGSCFLTCHGKNHDPLGYGPGTTLDGVVLVEGSSSESTPRTRSGTRGTRAAAPGLGPTTITVGPVVRGGVEKSPEIPGDGGAKKPE
ncbi:MAG: cytochrome c3 family protein [Thermoanaerobaculia bacterium]